MVSEHSLIVVSSVSHPWCACCCCGTFPKCPLWRIANRFDSAALSPAKQAETPDVCLPALPSNAPCCSHTVFLHFKHTKDSQAVFPAHAIDNNIPLSLALRADECIVVSLSLSLTRFPIFHHNSEKFAEFKITSECVFASLETFWFPCCNMATGPRGACLCRRAAQSYFLTSVPLRGAPVERETTGWHCCCWRAAWGQTTCGVLRTNRFNPPCVRLLGADAFPEACLIIQKLTESTNKSY